MNKPLLRKVAKRIKETFIKPECGHCWQNYRSEDNEYLLRDCIYCGKREYLKEPTGKRLRLIAINPEGSDYPNQDGGVR
jgi:DNA-directed RNA polymerase subunit RPC12/RpoP